MNISLIISTIELHVNNYIFIFQWKQFALDFVVLQIKTTETLKILKNLYMVNENEQHVVAEWNKRFKCGCESFKNNIY